MLALCIQPNDRQPNDRQDSLTTASFVPQLHTSTSIG